MEISEKIIKLTGVDRLKYLFKDTIVYGFTGAINKFLALLTVPLLTYFFNPSEYGIIDFFNFFLLLLNILFIFGQDSAVARFFYEYEDIYSKKQLITQSLVFQLILLIIFLPILWLLINNFVGSESYNGIIGKLIIIQTPFLLLINFAQNILRWTFDKNRFLFLSIGSNLFTFMIIFITLNFIAVGLIEIFIAYFFARFVFGIISILLIKKWFIFPSNYKYLLEMMPFAIPFGIVCTISALVPTIERTYIIMFLSDYELGIFALGYRIALFIALPIEAFQIAWGPFAIALYKQKDSIITYNWILKIFTVLIFTSVLLITFISGFLIDLMVISNTNANHMDYFHASLLVFALCMCIAIDGVLSIVDVGILFAKKSIIKIYSHSVFLLTAVIAIYFFINIYGIIGVAWGSLIAYIIKLCFSFWMSQKVYPLKWEFKKIIITGIVTLLLGLIAHLVSVYTKIHYGLYISGLGSLILIVFSWYFVFNKEEQNKILNNLHKLINTAR